MKNIKESKKIISIVIITLILLITTNVYALNDRYETTINTSNAQAKREDTITVTIGLRNIAIESGEKGIGAYTARIKFDSSVLEYVSTNSTDKWESPMYQNGLIVGNTKDGTVVNTAQNIGTITFKVKKDAKLGETDISLINFSGSTALTDVAAPNVATKLTIIDNISNNNNNTDNNASNTGSNNNNGSDTNNSNNSSNNNSSDTNTGNNNNNNNNGNNTTNSDNSSNNNNGSDNNNNNTDSNNNNNIESNNSTTDNINNANDGSTSSKKLPKVGKDSIIIYIVAVICVLLIIFCCIKLRKLKKRYNDN